MKDTHIDIKKDVEDTFNKMEQRDTIVFNIVLVILLTGFSAMGALM